MAGVEDTTRLHAMVEANRQAEREKLLSDARLRVKRWRVVTVDYHFHAFNLITWWVWFGLAVVAVLSDPVRGLPLGFIPAWFAVRAYRWMREDWGNIKRDIFGSADET